MTEKSDQKTTEKLTPLQLEQLVHFPHYLEQISPLIMYKFGAYTFSFRNLFESKHQF